MSYPYYRFFAGDYLRDTRRLTLLQHGAYHLLLHEYMASGKPLRGEVAAMCRICGALSGEEQMAVEFVLVEFFVHDGPLWRHKRCDREIDYLKTLSECGRKAAAMRWHSDGNANQNQNQNQNQKAEPTPKARSTPTPSATLPAGLAVSVDLWQAFRDHRKANRAPMTQRAETLLSKRLQELVAEGQDGVKVVEQSIERGWRGLFAVDRLRPAGKATARAATNAAIWGERRKDDAAIDGTAERMD